VYFNDPNAIGKLDVPEDGNVKLTNRHCVIHRDMGADTWIVLWISGCWA
jgi:hypothetical protein